MDAFRMVYLACPYLLVEMKRSITYEAHAYCSRLLVGDVFLLGIEFSNIPVAFFTRTILPAVYRTIHCTGNVVYVNGHHHQLFYSTI